MVSCNPIGPIFEGSGLNITVMSYQDRLDFGLQACPDLLPDVQGLADAMSSALDELEEAAGLASRSAGTQALRDPVEEEAPQERSAAGSTERRSAPKAKAKARKAPAKKAAAKETPAKKAATKKGAARKTTARKTAAEKGTAAKASAGKATPK